MRILDRLTRRSCSLNKPQSKATIQALFRRLLKEVSAELAIQPTDDPPPRSPLEVESALRGGPDKKGRRWVYGTEHLRRGSIAEFQVELYPDPVFRISAIVTTFTELINEGRKQFGGIDEREFDEMAAFNAILEKLLAGLVPLKCRIVDYAAIDVPEGQALVHRSLLDSLHGPYRRSAQNVFLVGVADRSSFWKDIRRILFSRARFNVLCRLNGNGISREWEPVKLVHLLSEVSPHIGGMVKLFSAGAIQSFSQAPQPSTPAAKTTAAYMAYGLLVSEKLSVELEGNDIMQMSEIASAAPVATTIDEMRGTFSQIAEVVQVKKNVKLDAVLLSQTRTEVLEAFELLPGDDADRSPPAATAANTPTVNEAYLDAEFVAIHW